MNEETLDVSEAVKKIESTVNSKIDALKQGLSDEQKQALDNAKNEMLKEFNAEIEAVKSQSISKEDFEKLQNELKETNKSIEDMANKAIEKQSSINVALKKFAEAYQRAEKGEKDEEARERGFDTALKMTSTDVMSVETVNSTDFPTAGSTGIVPTNYRALMAQFINVDTPRPYSPIMDLVDVVPLTGDQLILITEKVVGDFEITPECKEKPFVKLEITETIVSAEPLTALWSTTLKLRKFFAAILNRFEVKLRELLEETIPNYVLSQVVDNAIAFTPATGLATSIENPSYFDVIAAAIATQKVKGYKPNGVGLSPVAYAKMITAKDKNGAYQLANGQSIVIVGDTIKYGGQLLNAYEDPKLGDDEFIVGDFSKVSVAVDSEVFYLETDGRVDSNSQATSGLSKNIRTHEIAKFVAVGVADKSAITKDTFKNALTLIKIPS